MKISSLFVVVLLLLAFAGWVMNIAGIVHMINDPMITPMFIARIVGVFVAPLGAVLGYF